MDIYAVLQLCRKNTTLKGSFWGLIAPEKIVLL